MRSPNGIDWAIVGLVGFFFLAVAYELVRAVVQYVRGGRDPRPGFIDDRVLQGFLEDWSRDYYGKRERL